VQTGNFLNRTIFFIGWLLSPFTFWNDAFVNIPISYIFASLSVKIFPASFLFQVLMFYWLSNALGLFLMYLGGRHIAEKGRGAQRELVILILTIVTYSIILIAIDKLGILKPISIYLRTGIWRIIKA